MNIFPVEVQLFSADGQKDRRREVTLLIIALCKRHLKK